MRERERESQSAFNESLKNCHSHSLGATLSLSLTVGSTFTIPKYVKLKPQLNAYRKAFI